MQNRPIRFFSLIAAGCVVGFGCGPGGGGAPAAADADPSLSGTIDIDGSSTVFPLSEAFAEEFRTVAPNVATTIGTSGTGGGFKKFVAGEIDITGASRPIDETEIAAAARNGIQFVEIPIAFDGLSVVVNPQNDFVDHLTVQELAAIWRPDNPAMTWSQVRAGWPDQRIRLYGPGTDSGTFDYFTKAVVGKEKASRTDFQASEDDNVLVQGVAGDRFSLGYFGYAYVVENPGRLKLVPVDGGQGPVEPSPETIAGGTYQPLSRPLFFYVNKASLDTKPAVRRFVEFAIQRSEQLVPTTGYVALPGEIDDLALERVRDGVTGSAFSGAEIGVSVQDLLRRRSQ
jgi:phosphate transport system substrate-binding protein